MAYGAVSCLELTIERLLNSSHIKIVQYSSPEILKHLHDEILSLREALKEFDTRRSTINMKKVKTLEAKIIEAVYQFEDVIETYLSNHFNSHSGKEEETDHPASVLYLVDLQEIKQDVDFFIETMNKMKRAYIHELHNPSPEEDVVPLRNDFGGDKSKMVGLPYLFAGFKDRLDSSQSEQMIISLVGMPGIGKTTLAKKLFQYPFVVKRKRLFVTIGPKYQLADILVDILTQMNADIDEIMRMKGEKLLVELKKMVFRRLRFLRYLVVLDDVWDRELCCELLKLFPDDSNGSRVLFTTRLDEVAKCANPMSAYLIPLLDKKQSWDLLREKVFGEQESFSYKFAIAGKQIAENCEGLPLTIVTVANILSKADKTLEYWELVAVDKQNSVYKEAYDQMSNVLYPSYNYLDQHLKACFLYLGTFPQNHCLDGIDISNLWSVEGFFNPKSIHYLDPTSTIHKGVHAYLGELRSKNVIMYRRDKEERGFYLHSSFWYLCNKEAANTKLFYALNCLADALPEEGLNYQRRLCIRNNVLFAIEDVRDSITSASTVRSLLSTGPFHQYPVPLCLEHLRLLRVLGAVRFYEFPMEVLKLVQLRYFSLTYDGNLPTSISKLWNLEYLIVNRYRSIVKSSRNLSYMPVEIWNMKELKYIQTVGRDVPHPSEGSLLPNLLTLAGVGPQSCTKYVFEKIPNLKTLVIHIYLPPDATEQLTCFDHVSHLHQLQVLECDIANDILKTEVGPPLAPLSDFPSSLTKLVLSSFGYPWEQMSKISSLPNLQYLILKRYAFRGPKWEVHDDEFQSLRVLKIEDTDLEQWTFGNYCCLPAIKVLMFSHCYKLKEIPLTFGTSLLDVQVVDCNPMAGNCANKLRKVWDDKYGDVERWLNLGVSSSL